MKVSVESDESHPETTLLKLLYLVREDESRIAKKSSNTLRYRAMICKVLSPRSRLKYLHPGVAHTGTYSMENFGVTRTSFCTRPPPLARART